MLYTTLGDGCGWIKTYTSSSYLAALMHCKLFRHQSYKEAYDLCLTWGENNKFNVKVIHIQYNYIRCAFDKHELISWLVIGRALLIGKKYQFQWSMSFILHRVPFHTTLDIWYEFSEGGTICSRVDSANY